MWDDFNNNVAEVKKNIYIFTFLFSLVKFFFLVTFYANNNQLSK